MEGGVLAANIPASFLVAFVLLLSVFKRASMTVGSNPIQAKRWISNVWLFTAAWSEDFLFECQMKMSQGQFRLLNFSWVEAVKGIKGPRQSCTA